MQGEQAPGTDPIHSLRYSPTLQPAEVPQLSSVVFHPEGTIATLGLEKPFSVSEGTGNCSVGFSKIISETLNNVRCEISGKLRI